MPKEPESLTFLGMPAIICSGVMRELMGKVERVAQTNVAVLITGESGCGKELVARALHHHSMRCSRPWVDVSCAALPEHLVESELFGYERGAFSGANSAKPGLFELAHKGTLFLDEIGDLDPRMQVKLLRVLDGASYYRLGGVKKIAVDVRIAAATNTRIEEAIRAGRFRRDLFHRLSEVRLRVPPLREREEDIVPLAEHFLNHHDASLRLAPDAVQLLNRYSWPGNVRELKNIMTTAAVMAKQTCIRASDLPPEVRSPSPVCEAVDLRTLESVERRMIFETLSETGGLHKKAAERLGISSRTLSRKLKSYGMGSGPVDRPN